MPAAHLKEMVEHGLTAAQEFAAEALYRQFVTEGIGRYCFSLLPGRRRCLEALCIGQCMLLEGCLVTFEFM